MSPRLRLENTGFVWGAESVALLLLAVLHHFLWVGPVTRSRVYQSLVSSFLHDEWPNLLEQVLYIVHGEGWA